MSIQFRIFDRILNQFCGLFLSTYSLIRFFLSLLLELIVSDFYSFFKLIFNDFFPQFFQEREELKGLFHYRILILQSQKNKNLICYSQKTLPT